MRAIIRSRLVDVSIAGVGLALALALRLSLIDFKSIDYFNYTKIWYNALKVGGFAAFGQNFSNYNLPYLYLLYVIARFLPGIPGLVATKLPSIAADFIDAWLAYRIVRLRYRGSLFPFLAGFSCLFAPTVVLNSAFWGQADALYCSALVACLYCLVSRRGAAAMLLFGVSLAFKAQALFLAPLLIALFLRRELSWKYVFLSPLVMLLSLVPALAAGRSLLDLLLIYPAQAGQYQQLSMHAPSALSWLPDSGRFYPYFYPAGLILAASAALAYSLAVYRSRTEITPPLLVELALISVLMLPFVLPKMHERYFYVADVLSIILVFYVPRLFFVPLSMITISFFSYQPTLFGVEPVPIGLLALGVFVLLVVLGRDALAQLFPSRLGDQICEVEVQLKP
jgi:Gpi18-like mannosyltransferase